MKIVSVLWKTPVVAGAVVLGAIGASQVTWSGADWVLNGRLMGFLEQFITGLYFLLGCVVVCGTWWSVYRIAKPALWVLAPVIAYAALVLGLWNGIISDFDYSRGEALRHGAANAYALQHMTPRGLYRSCHDERIELTEDGKAYCVRASSVGPGEPIPGSEHVCSGLWEKLLGMACFYSGSDQ